MPEGFWNSSIVFSLFQFFQNYESEVHTRPIKMAQNPKIAILVTYFPQLPSHCFSQIWLCKVFWGFYLDEYPCMPFELFRCLESEAHTSPLDMAQNPKIAILVTVPSNYLVAGFFKYGYLRFGMKLLLSRYYLNVSVTRPRFYGNSPMHA